MKASTRKLMDGLKIQRLRNSRTMWGSRKVHAEYYRAQRAGGLGASIHEMTGRKSKPTHAKALRNYLKSGQYKR